MRLQGSAAASSRSLYVDALVFSRRVILGTALVPLGFVTSPKEACGAPELPRTPAPATQRFEVAFEYTPVSRDERTESRQVRVPVEIQAPATSAVQPNTGGTPVVIFSPGFLQSPESYSTFLSKLLDAGLVVVTYDKPLEDLSSLVDDLDSAALLVQLRTEVATRLGGAGVGPCFLAGHSRGAKLSVLAAAAAAAPPPGLPPLPPSLPVASGPLPAERNSQQQHHQASPPEWPVSGLVLLDPADGAFEPQDPARYPSALPPLRNRAGALAGAPVLVVGAGRGGDCVPRAKNYGAFFGACRGPSVLVTLRDAGHLQFLDASGRLAQSICAAGRVLANAQVAAASGRLAADFILRGDCGPAGGAQRAGGGEGGGGGSDGGPGAAAAAGASGGGLAALCEESLRGAGLRYEVRASAGDSEGAG